MTEIKRAGERKREIDGGEEGGACGGERFSHDGREGSLGG